MFKVVMENLKSLGFKAVVILLIEALLLTAIPSGASAEESVRYNGSLSIGTAIDIRFDKNDDLPLILTAAIDKGELKLSWNKKNDGTNRFYVLKRTEGSIKYEVVSNPRGIKENYFITIADKALNANYMICESSLPIKENASFKKLFVETKGKELETKIDISKISNEITINERLTKPAQPVFSGYTKDSGKANLAWATYDRDNKYYLVFRKAKGESYFGFEKTASFTDYRYSSDARYYVWAFDDNGNASTPMVYQDKAGSQTNEDGFFALNDGSKTVIKHEGLTIEIPQGATKPGSFINITNLGIADMENIPDGMPNVTYSKYNTPGYDITLNGDARNKFDKEVKVSIKYDKNKIPKYLNEDSVYAFYYDDALRSWQHVKRSDLDKTNGTVTGTVNHFCQFYAGMMSIASEPPQAKGINTTPVNIATVDPMTGIKGINPPSPNNQRSANVSYPIEVPAGINGMTPNISINYSSEAREGNCGYGWNLGVSSITIDTKKGVPKYDNSSDVLLLDGRELVKTGTEGSNTIYRYKNEGAFSKVVKQSDNSFIVYQTDGSKLFYGENDASRFFKVSIYHY